MSLETVPGTDLTYYLIAFDDNGNERSEPDGTIASRQVLSALAAQPVTDIFMFSHGWMGDVPAARAQYNAWIGAMAACSADRAAMAQIRPNFKPLLVGLHWPSLPWGDENLGPAAPSFSATAATPIDDQVNLYAQRIVDTPAARAALKTIFQAAYDNAAPDELPQNVKDAYAALDRESKMKSGGPASPPDADREPFSAENIYQNAKQQDAVASFGDFSLSNLLTPLQTMSYWKMKDRARVFGESGGTQLLAKIQTTAPTAKLHLMGHSFGCVVASSILAGPGGNGPITRSIDSLALVQGAFSLWSFCPDISFYAPGSPGYFLSVVRDNRVKGPIVTTQSTHDRAVGTWYPLASGVAGQIVFDKPPKYGGVGSFGIRGLASNPSDLSMLPATVPYSFAPGSITNIESSQYISKILDTFSGAHSDIAHPEVAHAVWSAAMKT